MSVTLGFIGIGNMGAGMAANLIKAGHSVIVYDLDASKLSPLTDLGGQAAGSFAEIAQKCDIIFTMLPKAVHVQDVCLQHLFPEMSAGKIIVDCSTIDVDSAKSLGENAAKQQIGFMDAPVSGGASGAEAGTLTFMVGGAEDNFAKIKPYFDIMGAKAVHCGQVGSGQAVKICNNLMLGIQMISVAEGFVLGEKLGVDPQTLFDVVSTSSGQCWSVTSYCPVPGPVPTSPANKNYDVGFLTHLMLKDLNLAKQAASGQDLSLAMLQEALSHYQAMMEDGRENKDFSNVIEFIRARHEKEGI